MTKTAIDVSDIDEITADMLMEHISGKWNIGDIKSVEFFADKFIAVQYIDCKSPDLQEALSDIDDKQTIALNFKYFKSSIWFQICSSLGCLFINHNQTSETLKVFLSTHEFVSFGISSKIGMLKQLYGDLQITLKDIKYYSITKEQLQSHEPVIKYKNNSYMFKERITPFAIITFCNQTVIVHDYIPKFIAYLRSQNSPQTAQTDKPTKAPAKQQIDKPKNEPPAKQQNDKPKNAPAKQQNDKPTKAPAKQQIDKPTKAPAKQQNDKPKNAPAKQQNDKPKNAPAKQQNDKPTKAPAKQQNDKPKNELVDVTSEEKISGDLLNESIQSLGGEWPDGVTKEVEFFQNQFTKVTFIYSSNPNLSDLLKSIDDGKPIAMDLEWNPFVHKIANVFQLCSSRGCLVIQNKNNSEILKEFLETHSFVMKDISNDRRMLRQTYGDSFECDINDIAATVLRRYGFGESFDDMVSKFSDKKPCAKFKDKKISMSKWDKSVSVRMILYAAYDVVALNECMPNFARAEEIKQSLKQSSAAQN